MKQLKQLKNYFCETKAGARAVEKFVDELVETRRKFTILLNDAKAGRKEETGPIFTIRNQDDTTKPLEILIYDVIGKDPWTGEGFTAKDFVTQLDKVPKTRELHIRLNSRGGIVDEGIAIYNRLREWQGKTIASVDGAAASIASVIIMGADEVHMPKSAEILIHEAHAIAFGDAKGMRELADRLDSASNRIAGIYADKTKKSVDQMREYMRKTTVFDGAKAKEIGLADVLTDEASLYNFSPQDIESFRQQPAPPPPTKPNQTQNMNRAEIIALLRKRGISVADDVTDAQLMALLTTAIQNVTPPPNPANTPAPEVVALQNAIAALQKERDAEKKTRITAEIDKLIGNNQLPGAKRDQFIARAVADETILDEYRALPSHPPGADPVGVVLNSEDPKDVANFLIRDFRDDKIRMKDVGAARADGIERARVFNLYREKIMPLMNANNVDAALKRVVILQDMIRAFSRRLLPLRAFSTVFNGVALAGTGQVVVPYFPLDTTASQDFVQANGYQFPSSSNANSKTINVSQAAGGKRKYQDFSFNSDEFRRQPYFDSVMLFRLKAEALASDVFVDVMSVVKRATFGNPVKTKAAAAFNADDISDIKGACTRADWPDAGRSLLLDSDYEAALTKDSQIVGSLDQRAAAVVIEGLLPMLKGFQPYSCPRIPDNGENLKGAAVFQSAVLFATAPIEPTPDVRAQMTQYEVIVDPQTGASFELRRWGDPTKDTSYQVAECNYGYTAGEVAALKIIAAA